MNPKTIEFGYDQPKLATSVLRMIANKEYLNAQNYVDVNPYQAQSYGPFLLYLLTPYLVLTRNPLYLSYLMVMFNGLGLAIVYFIGRKIDPLVGAVACLLTAISFWNIIFSRMIYQPTMLPVFITLSILATIEIREKKSRVWIIILLPLLVIMAQIHLISGPIAILEVFISAAASFVANKKEWLAGCLLAGLILSPNIYFEITHGGETINRFISNSLNYSTNISITKRFGEVIKQFTDFTSGRGLSWQLGYAYPEFEGKAGYVERISEYLLGILTVTGLAILGWQSILGDKKSRLLLLTTLSVPIFLIFIPLPDIVPRYFYPLTPILALIAAITLAEIVRSFGLNKGALIAGFIILIIATGSIMKINRYFAFIQNYTYPTGFLSLFSDIPYSFVKESLDWVVTKAKNNNACKVSISSDLKDPWNMNLNWAQSYTWDYVLTDKGPWCEDNKIAYFMVHIAPPTEEEKLNGYRQFGPYVAYQIAGPEENK
jgi:hypothetical protein